MRGAATRRQALVGGASFVAITGSSFPATALWPWWTAFTAGVAAGWLVEALKNWGLVPQAHASTLVEGAHRSEVVPLQRQGYNVRPVFSGAYSGGDFELSEAKLGDDFLALSTTDHARNTCTLKLDKADTINLGLVAKALRQKGLQPDEIEAAAMPVHPPLASRFNGNRRHSPDYMTPSDGTIAWSTDVYSEANLVTSIRSSIINADLRFAWRDGGWKFDMRRI